MPVAIEHTSTEGDVRVETGTGLIRECKHEPGKRNASIHILATHTNLTKPVTAWADTTDPTVWPLAGELYAAGTEVEYRVEVRRKHGAPLDKPIAELPSDKKVRELAAIAPKGELSAVDRIRPENALNVPESDETTPTPQRPPEPDSGPHSTQEPPGDDESRPGWLTDAGREATEQRQAHRADPSADPASPKQRRVEEARPWVLYNTDGSLNLGSYSYQAAVGMVELAHNLLAAHARDQAYEDGNLTAAEPPSPGKLYGLARTLIEAADAVQARARQDGHVDRQDNSHPRARGAIVAALDAHPVPWDAPADVRAKWQADLVDHAASILTVAYRLFKFHETGDAS